jgi:undecaprenol kinase
MKRMRRSFGFAIAGLKHAVEMERNLQLFIPVYILVLILGGMVRLITWEWLALIFAGGLFLSTELLNTAIERLVDVLDDERKVVGRNHYFKMLKATKDVGAAASLMSLLAVIATVCIVFAPYVNIYVLH